MYNLTVATAHTYFVGEGEWLVHNECINPKYIRYTQDSGGQYFKDGRRWIDLAEGLKSGTVNPNDVPPIRVFEYKGNLWTLDNRRLAAFEYAGVDINFVWASAEEVVSEMWKMTTRNNGLSIVIRGLNIIVGK